MKKDIAEHEIGHFGRKGFDDKIVANKRGHNGSMNAEYRFIMFAWVKAEREQREKKDHKQR
jgi:hypothetical protein